MQVFPKPPSCAFGSWRACSYSGVGLGWSKGGLCYVRFKDTRQGLWNCSVYTCMTLTMRMSPSRSGLQSPTCLTWARALLRFPLLHTLRALSSWQAHISHLQMASPPPEFGISQENPRWPTRFWVFQLLPLTMCYYNLNKYLLSLLKTKKKLTSQIAYT